MKIAGSTSLGSERASNSAFFVLYRRKARGRFGGSQTTFDAMDFLARLLMHIPQPKLHTIRYYGEHSSVARARRRAEKAEAEVEESSATVLPSCAERRRLRRAWAQMIRRILRHIAEKAKPQERAPPASVIAS